MIGAQASACLKNLLGGLFNSRLMGPTHRFSDSVDLDEAQRFTFLSSTLVRLMLLVWGPHTDINYLGLTLLVKSL